MSATRATTAATRCWFTYERIARTQARGRARRSARSRDAKGSSFAPLENDLALGDVPGFVNSGEDVEIVQPRDHHSAGAVLGEDVMRNGVAVTGRTVAVDRDGALAVEVHRDFVPVEVVEHRRQRFSSFEHVARIGARTVHVDGEPGVCREESLLALGVARIR